MRELPCRAAVDVVERGPGGRATPTCLEFCLLEKLCRELIEGLPGVVSVTCDIASKPPSTIEAV